MYNGELSACVPFNDAAVLQAALEQLPSLQPPVAAGRPSVSSVAVTPYRDGYR
jgi:hypothetical protein